jgi:general secretion pathway protein I
MRDSSGFTLLEVLAALLIFALTAVVLGGAYVNVLNSYEAARKSNVNDEDITFARSQLLTIADLQTAQHGMEFDDGDRHVKWICEIDPATTTDLFSVAFTCTITEPGAAKPTVSIQNFMLLRPTWSDPAARTTLRQAAADRIALFQGKQAH